MKIVELMESLIVEGRKIEFTPKIKVAIINWYTQGYTHREIGKLVNTSKDLEFIRVLKGGTVSKSTIGIFLRSQPNISELERKHIKARLAKGLPVKGRDINFTPRMRAQIIDWYTQGNTQREIEKLVSTSEDPEFIKALRGGTISQSKISKFLNSQPNLSDLERKYINARLEKGLPILGKEINFTLNTKTQIIDWFTQGNSYKDITQLVNASTAPEFINMLNGRTITQATIGIFLRSQPNISELERKHIKARLAKGLPVKGRDINFTPYIVSKIIDWFTQGYSYKAISKLVSTSKDPAFIKALRGGTVSETKIFNFLRSQPNKAELVAKNRASREAERQRRKQQPVTTSTVTKATGRGRGVTSIGRAGPPTGGKL